VTAWLSLERSRVADPDQGTIYIERISKMKKNGNSSIQDGPAIDYENETELDWEEVEKFLADPDWEEVEKWLPDQPELAEHEAKIRRNATFQRILRLASEENSEQFHKEVEGLQLTAEEIQELSDRVYKEFDELAWQHTLHSCGQAAAENPFRIAILYKQFNPQDGVECVLTSTMIALSEATLDCSWRAFGSDAPQARDIELKHATRSALVLAALARTFDSHRERFVYPKKKKRK
jgi:hypothetical protein